MSQHLPLLIELGCEELPVKALPGLAQTLFDGVLAGLDKRGIGYDREQARALYTPRRLAVRIDAVATRQPEQHSEVLGPYLNIALDADGQPTKALQGFAAKAGIDWTTLERTTDNKGKRFVHRSVKPGATTAELLAEIVSDAVAALPIPKPMRWGDHDYAFVRPVHWLVLLFGSDVIDCALLGVRSGRESRGHRFHAPAAIALASPSEYEPTLHQARVIVDPDLRRAAIAAMVEQAASDAGGRARIDEGILDEVNCLVEWPVPIACGFERDFLRVPQEALILTMETNQKFFPVLDGDGRLTEHFIGVSNIESTDAAEIRKGYERVIRPRFADARFFFDEDLKQGLASMNQGLANVTYQAKLGSIADKVERIAKLAEAIAELVQDKAGRDASDLASHLSSKFSNDETDAKMRARANRSKSLALAVSPTLIKRAAELSKADLQSRMVNEFPELQGIAGRYYAYDDDALNDLDDTDRAKLALSLDEVYMPRNAGDGIATSRLGQVLAIAERLDTLAGGFAAGLKPTGNKDPFALRRNALGLARTLLEGDIKISLTWLIEKAAAILLADLPDLSLDTAQVEEFVMDRVRSYIEQRNSYSAGAFETALHRDGGVELLNEFVDRHNVFKRLPETEEGRQLIGLYKRVNNQLTDAEKKGYQFDISVSETYFLAPAERSLFEALELALPEFDTKVNEDKLYEALIGLTAINQPLDQFFSDVMVQTEDPDLRRNRLSMLNKIRQSTRRVGDLSRLIGG